MDGSNSFIFFIYNQLEWLQGPINIGFKNSNGSQSFMLTETTNEDDVQELRLLETSNVGVPGLYLYQVDGEITINFSCVVSIIKFILYKELSCIDTINFVRCKLLELCT